MKGNQKGEGEAGWGTTDEGIGVWLAGRAEVSRRRKGAQVTEIPAPPSPEVRMAGDDPYV